MRSFSSVLLAISLVVISGCRPAAAPVAVGNTPISVNDIPARGAPNAPLKPISEMSWTGFNGDVRKLKDYQGKVVILDFWATYCLPCVEEIPHLMELQTKYGADRLLIVGLHVGGEDDRPKVPAFSEKLKITYPLAYPEDALMSFVFGQQTAIPQTAVFDRSGRLVKKITGFNRDIRTDLDTAVAEAMMRDR